LFNVHETENNTTRFETKIEDDDPTIEKVSQILVEVNLTFVSVTSIREFQYSAI